MSASLAVLIDQSLGDLVSAPYQMLRELVELFALDLIRLALAGVLHDQRGPGSHRQTPFALLDLVGLDTSLSILDALYNEFRDPNYAAMPTLRRMVAAGQLGRKSKAGFYSY